jgi:hypothetical protein
MGHKNNHARVEPDLSDAPQHEAAIDATSAVQERLDYASNAIEFARRQLRDGHPLAAANLEQIAHANLIEARTMLNEFLDNWSLLLCDDKIKAQPQAYDRILDDIAKGKEKILADAPLAWK